MFKEESFKTYLSLAGSGVTLPLQSTALFTVADNGRLGREGLLYISGESSISMSSGSL